ncbi:hypothetical protein ACFOMD_17575 [Sphingoaurantiacus capsulatus]|uniref:Uncharacterized protein n=1 Tax=Sphingoaurantiacus capsulatus TaxID=1771310 RepID=A0ABV7XHD6_9SPHN
MAFEPFGYRFVVDSTMSRADAKIAISARLVGWFDVKDGARGWIAGPYICLWRQVTSGGPMVVAKISGTATGTSVRGRAGSNLNGLLIVPFLAAFVIFMVIEALLEGERPDGVSLIFFFVMGPFLLWMAHKDRRAADPLVRFLRDTLSGEASPRFRKSRPQAIATGEISRSLTMDVNGDRSDKAADAAAVQEALARLETDDFLILSAADEDYVQTLATEDGFIFEKREGSPPQQYKALWRDGASAARETLTVDEILLALLAYALETPMPEPLGWEPIDT